MGSVRLYAQVIFEVMVPLHLNKKNVLRLNEKLSGDPSSKSSEHSKDCRLALYPTSSIFSILEVSICAQVFTSTLLIRFLNQAAIIFCRTGNGYKLEKC